MTDSTAMRRVVCALLLATIGLVPTVDARTTHRAQISRRELRKRYVAKPFNNKARNAPKAKWGAPKGH